MERRKTESRYFEIIATTLVCVLFFYPAASGMSINVGEESTTEEIQETKITVEEQFVTEMALEVLELEDIYETTVTEEETDPPTSLPETTVEEQFSTQEVITDVPTETLQTELEEISELTTVEHLSTEYSTQSTEEPIKGLMKLELSDDLESDKIINGDLAEEGSYTSVVSLQHVNNSQPFCGGTILNRDFVLTAAHCIFAKDGENLIDFKVVSSNIDLKREIRTYYPVTVIVHALYNKSIFLGYDIALVKVEPSFVLGDGESAVVLPKQNEETEVGTKATVVGWGRTDQRFTSDRVLRVLDESVIENSECEERLNFHPPIHAFHLCAQPRPNTGFCKGDSGGPVFVGRKQVGVVSWYKGNCSHEEPLPNVFTRVAHFADWILEKIDEEENQFE
ncbi:trypsin eta-like [Cloeon dipterum]|uniref:trypsin eta-like n=1 Tax=Cloeon dipterum TaxID=197152 RepID=UPI00322055C9